MIAKILTIIAFIMISWSAYTRCTDHKSFVLAAKQQIDSVYIKEEKNLEYRHMKLHRIIRSNVDLKEISRFVIGKHWTLISDKERESFLKGYEIYLTDLCVNFLYKYMNNSEMTILGSEVIDDRSCLVSTRFSFSKEEFTNIDFKVSKNDSSFLIGDIIMNGASISINQRSQFSEKIDAYGIAGIISRLKYNNDL